MAKSKCKRANGVGEYLSVNFDITDPTERKAQKAAQLLAAKHGRRKQAIVTFLVAVYDHYERCNELPTPVEIAAALNGFDVQKPSIGFNPRPPSVTDDTPQITVSKTPRLSADEQAKRSAANFLK